MEALFKSDIDDLKELGALSDKDVGVLEEADKAAEELAEPEYEHYLKHEFNSEAIGILAKHNLFGVPVEKKYGGTGSGALVHALVQQRLGQLGLGVSTLYDVQTFIAEPTVQRWGTEEQKSEHLKNMCSGKSIFAFGLTEPGEGSDQSLISTTYEESQGGYLLNGTKYLISNGSICNYIILFAARKAPGPKKEITAFIVDTKSKGFKVEMKLEEKIGLFTSDTSMLSFENVLVEKDAVLGGIGNGLRVAYSALLNGRIGIGSACIGVIEASLNASLKRSRERVQHGKQIGKHQLIQQHISAMRQNLEMARWPIFYAAMKKQEFDKDPNNVPALREMDMYSAMAKRIASRLAFESADRAVQVHGGFGYSLMSPVGQLFCDSRVARIYEGTDEIHDLKIASELLGDEFKAYR
ncbi:MAG: acyl-CoA dehydrogenase domain protein [Candidatus Micrarchaeum acidiphilum ARMAN-2]|jgi:alkylation response protein AidB-like acyl-CoA dehydrogenase|uniref:Acyl-CoA dehydrogenase domain protein n=1 Tax=Candidatus Micrarchaeum acidiphilum ARMAN-2 TaxID=425595 RepID=C7DHK4_MICA2|nr:MAG: acyl-CoA dehydrogenase domain protein [Candidatus Micrarchaeum acidiphilum ARMAN-2]